MGAPGSGKGTQAKILSEKSGLLHLSTGDILRAEVKAGSELGNKAKGFMDAGKLVPDQLILDMIKNKLASPELNSGFIFDGFPRTVPQAEGLDQIASEVGIEIAGVVNIVVNDEEIIKRLTARSFCPKCGAIYNDIFNPPQKENLCDKDGEKLTKRVDDKEDVVRDRLKVYHEQTQPLEDFYKSQKLLIDIAGSGSVQDIAGRIDEVVSSA